ncbi:Probable serine hydrolase [Gryllus bimaculatus]|nr:Probable serine hydrolase [Gryllus bimaculatus]
MADVPEIEIPMPWGHVTGKWWGPRDKQPVLALHGWQDNAGTFDKLAPLLTPHMALLCIDMPGHGRSSHYPKGQYYYLFWDGLLLVRRIVKHFNWKSVSIIGHSLGGAIGFLYAASFPEEIDKLVQLDIASPTVRDISRVVNDTGTMIDRFLKYENLSVENMPCYNYDEMIGIVVDAYKSSLTKDSSEVMMKRGMVPAASATTNGKGDTYNFCRDVRLKVAGMGMLSLDMVLEYATKIKCEVLNLKANPGLRFDNPQYYGLVLDKVRENAKRVVYHEVEGTHHLHLNNPERISSYIISFFNSTNLPNAGGDAAA